jgi:hypothetical protein
MTPAVSGEVHAVVAAFQDDETGRTREQSQLGSELRQEGVVQAAEFSDDVLDGALRPLNVLLELLFSFVHGWPPADRSTTGRGRGASI